MINERNNDQVETVEAEVVQQEQEAFLTIDRNELSSFLKATESLKEMETAVNIKMEYKRFAKENEICRGVFLGFGKTKNAEGKELDSVIWVEEGGTTFCHSGVILVDDCRKFGFKPGAGIQIEYLGRKKGKAMDFRVHLLKHKQQ